MSEHNFFFYHLVVLSKKSLWTIIGHINRTFLVRTPYCYPHLDLKGCIRWNNLAPARSLLAVWVNNSRATKPASKQPRQKKNHLQDPLLHYFSDFRALCVRLLALALVSTMNSQPQSTLLNIISVWIVSFLFWPNNDSNNDDENHFQEINNCKKKFYK